MTDKNMNELRGLPKDIDLLITAAKQVIRARALDTDEDALDRRILNLSNIVDRVEPQYKEIMKSALTL